MHQLEKRFGALDVVIGPSSLAGGKGEGKHFRRGAKGRGCRPKGFHASGLKGSPGSVNPRGPNGEIMT
eukprot:12047797-Karenia_brevis.AAC.1